MRDTCRSTSTGGTIASATSLSPKDRGNTPPSRTQPPPPRNSSGAETERVRPSHGVLDRLTNAPADELKAVSPRPLHNQRPSLEGRRWVGQSPPSPRPRITAGKAHADHLSTEANDEEFPNGGKSGGNGASIPIASSKTNIRVSLQGRGGFERDRENTAREGPPVPLPKGMTGELMRQVAALDVTRMSCDQVSGTCLCDIYRCATVRYEVIR